VQHPSLAHEGLQCCLHSLGQFAGDALVDARCARTGGCSGLRTCETWMTLVMGCGLSASDEGCTSDLISCTMFGSKNGRQQSKSHPGAHDIGHDPGHVSKGEGPATGKVGGCFSSFFGGEGGGGGGGIAGIMAPQQSGEQAGAQDAGHCALQICAGSM